MDGKFHILYEYQPKEMTELEYPRMQWRQLYLTGFKTFCSNSKQIFKMES